MKDQHKKEVESALLDTMKAIDRAVHVIVQVADAGDEYAPEVNGLLACRKIAKQMLNKHFDELARKG